MAPKNAPKKLSWEETASEMAADDEDWSDWERLPDGWNPECSVTKFITRDLILSRAVKSEKHGPV